MNIRVIFEKQGMTTKEVADKLNMSVSGLNQHISGNPSVKVLRAIADVVGCDVMDFFRDEAIHQEVQDGGQVCPECGTRLKLVKE